MVRHAPIHRRSGHSDIAICCGRNVLGSSPSTYGGAPLESGHHFESQTIQRIQNVFGRTLTMRTKDLFPSKYLQSSDAKAKHIIATISHMAQEMVGQGQDQKLKPVLYLEDQKPM